MISRSGGNYISCAANRIDHFTGERFVDFRPQPTDMNFHDVSSWIEVKIPDPFEQHGLGDDATWVAHEIFEHFEFLRLQLDRHAGASHGSSQNIHLEIADP